MISTVSAFKKSMVVVTQKKMQTLSKLTDNFLSDTDNCAHVIFQGLKGKAATSRFRNSALFGLSHLA